MRLIVITPPESGCDEPQLVACILERFPVTLHLRKPGAKARQIAGYLNQMSAVLHSRIMVHGHAELLAQFNLKGIHFTEKARAGDLRMIHRLRCQQSGICISSAFHHIADIPAPDGLFDYILLSPIFDSISKTGYRAAFEPEVLKRFLSRTGHAVIALGGIDEQRIHAAAGLGFKGAAVLGAVWQAADPVAAAGRLWAVCHDIGPLPVHGK